jgi:hypothetical protein
MSTTATATQKTRFTLKGSDKEHIKFSPWASGNGEMPRQAAKAEGKDVFNISLEGKQVEVRRNKSRGGTTYNYVKLGNGYYWTRDELKAGQEFVGYVKPAPVEKPAKEAKAKTTTTGTAKTDETKGKGDTGAA